MIRSAMLGSLPNRGLAPPALLGLAHAAVDASSGVVLGQWLPEVDPARLVLYFVLYDACAFALQPLFGMVGDRLARPRALALAGIGLALAALLVPSATPWLPVVVTGVGNALFHVGAGVMASTATPERAAGCGVFIGPGSIGVLVGMLAGAADASPEGLPGLGLATAWPFATALVASLAVVLALAPGAAAWPPPPRRTPRSGGLGVVVAALLLTAIGVRAFVGFAALDAVAGVAHAGIVLALAAFLGKTVGGLVADRWGWRRTSTAALAGAALIFLVDGDSLAVAAAGVVLFQVVTGVTLAGLYGVWPRWIGLGFGLACLALVLGGLPFIAGWHVETRVLVDPALVSGLTLVAAAAIWGALALLPRLGVSAALARRISPRRAGAAD